MPVPNSQYNDNISLTKDIAGGIYSDWSEQLQGNSIGWEGVGNISLSQSYTTRTIGKGAIWNGSVNPTSSNYSIGAVTGKYNGIPYMIGYPDWDQQNYYSANYGWNEYTWNLNTTFYNGFVMSGDAANNNAYYGYIGYSTNTGLTIGSGLAATGLRISGTATANNYPNNLGVSTSIGTSLQNPGTYGSMHNVTVAMMAACSANDPLQDRSKEDLYGFAAYRNTNDSGYAYFRFAQFDFIAPAFAATTTTNRYTTYTNSIIPDACYAGYDSAGYDVCLFLMMKNNSGCQLVGVKRNNSYTVASNTQLNIHNSTSNFATGYNGGVCSDAFGGYWYAAYGEVYNATYVTSDNVKFISGSITQNTSTTAPSLTKYSDTTLVSSARARAVTCELIAKDVTYNWILVAYSENSGNNIYYRVMRHTKGGGTIVQSSGTLISGSGSTPVNVNQRIRIAPHGMKDVDYGGGDRALTAFFSLSFINQSSATGLEGYTANYYYDCDNGLLYQASGETAGRGETLGCYNYALLSKTNILANWDPDATGNDGNFDKAVYRYTSLNSNYRGYGAGTMLYTNLVWGINNDDPNEYLATWYYT
jgi:hypothetical protein